VRERWLGLSSCRYEGEIGLFLIIPLAGLSPYGDNLMCVVRPHDSAGDRDNKMKVMWMNLVNISPVFNDLFVFT